VSAPPHAAAAAPGALAAGIAAAGPPSGDPPSAESASARAAPGEAAAATSAAERPRLLVIAIEAIPYDAAALWTDPERTDPPLFGGLAGPVPVVSTFPSTSSLAFTGMFAPLGLPPAPGYEVRWFDRAAGRLRGGGPVSVRRRPFGWKSVFDYEIEGLGRKGIGYGWPDRYAPREIDRMLAAFRASDADPFFGYLSLPDALAHHGGPDALLAALRHLDRGLDAARAAEPRGLSVVIFSDHGVAGGERLANVRRAVRRALRAAGLRIHRRLRRPGDVVLIPYGLLSSLIAFTRPGGERAAAAALAGAPGVELCAHPAGEGRWAVLGGGGEAAIERRADGRYRYLALTGDPLGYEPIARALARERAGAGGDPDGGWHPAEAWLAASLDARFPDAPRRIATGFELVANPASVLCSLAPGHSYGSAWTELGARVSLGGLRWTHGGLRRGDSLGFVMTDLPGWTPGARGLAFDELVPALGLSRPAARGARAPAGAPARPRPAAPPAARGRRGR